MAKAMQKDVDIMGVQRGTHISGPDVCPKYVFTMPGGKNADGSTLWGWNDIRAAYCANCGQRDIDHVVVRDLNEEVIRKDRGANAAHEEREQRQGREAVRTRVDVLREAGIADPTAANPRASYTASKPETDPLEAAARLGMLELEPGVPDPLAMNAYRDAARQQSERQAERIARLAAETVAAVTAKEGEEARAPTGGAEMAGADDESERFKAEVEKMVKEQLARERLSILTAPAAGAPSSVKQLLGSLGLERYLARFEAEEMEMPVLIALARGEGKDALDAALKELGVNSIGHRLKIFAALQGS